MEPGCDGGAPEIVDSLNGDHGTLVADLKIEGRGKQKVEIFRVIILAYVGREADALSGLRATDS